jgi:hypothetical protein
MPKSPQYRGDLNVRPIGILPAETCWLNSSGELLDALEAKAGRYGMPDLPFLIAVNHVGWHCDRGDVLAALYGAEKYVYQSRGSEMVQTDSYRESNGLWRGRSGSRNQHVSAILIGHHVNTWSLNSSSVEMYFNPWGSQDISVSDWRLAHLSLDSQGELTWKGGEEAGRILGVPTPWPLAWESE